MNKYLKWSLIGLASVAGMAGLYLVGRNYQLTNELVELAHSLES